MLAIRALTSFEASTCSFCRAVLGARERVGELALGIGSRRASLFAKEDVACDDDEDEVPEGEVVDVDPEISPVDDDDVVGISDVASTSSAMSSGRCGRGCRMVCFRHFANG